MAGVFVMAGEGTRNPGVTPAPADTLREALELWAAGVPMQEVLALLDSHVLVPRETVEQAAVRFEWEATSYHPTPPEKTQPGRIAAVLRACLGGEAK